MLDIFHKVIRVQNERICSETGQYSRQTPGSFIVNRQASQITMARPCLRHNTPPKIILLGTVVDSRRRERPRKS